MFRDGDGIQQRVRDFHILHTMPGALELYRRGQSSTSYSVDRVEGSEMIPHWSVITAAWYFILGYISSRNNTSDSAFWYWATFIWGCAPLWAWVSRHSDNLALDALIFDAIMFSAFYVSIIIMSSEKQNVDPLLLVAGAAMVAGGLMLARMGSGHA